MAGLQCTVICIYIYIYMCVQPTAHSNTTIYFVCIYYCCGQVGKNICLKKTCIYMHMMYIKVRYVPCYCSRSITIARRNSLLSCPRSLVFERLETARTGTTNCFLHRSLRQGHAKHQSIRIILPYTAKS